MPEKDRHGERDEKFEEADEHMPEVIGEREKMKQQKRARRKKCQRLFLQMLDHQTMTEESPKRSGRL